MTCGNGQNRIYCRYDIFGWEGPLVKRIDKENYYLDIAETVLERSTCLRRCYGAIIVKK